MPASRGEGCPTTQAFCNPSGRPAAVSTVERVDQEREKFEWEREHSPFTPEGQIESARMFGRGALKHPKAAPRIILALAVLFAVLAVVALVESL